MNFISIDHFTIMWIEHLKTQRKYVFMLLNKQRGSLEMYSVSNV